MNTNKRFTMALYLVPSLIMALIISTSAVSETHLDKDITTSMQEMQRAGYFTFVTLLHMVQDKIPCNTTFLMPSDRALSKAAIPENKMLGFLLSHSIPLPLLFADLLHFPTGTMVPTHQQDYMLKIVNGGRRRFYLNNVELVSANICISGSSFRCHGIYGVLNRTAVDEKTPTTCSQASPPTPIAAGPSPQPLVGSPSLVPMISPPPTDLNDRPQKSNSSDKHCQVLFTTIVSCMIISLMKLLF